MLQELIARDRVAFAESFTSWEEAVSAAAQPLIRDGAIEQEYVDAIIACIKEYGPYIVIAPDIALPHAKGGVGVKETSIAFLKVKQPVHFSDSAEHDARLLFVLASVDDNAHLDMLQKLVDVLSDEAFVERLLDVDSVDGLIGLLKAE